MQNQDEDRSDITELGAVSVLTEAIGNRWVEPNMEPLRFE
jgi:hypothetical protein